MPNTEAGKQLSLRRATQNGIDLKDSAAMAVLNRDIIAIESEAVFTYLSSPEFENQLALALSLYVRMPSFFNSYSDFAYTIANECRKDKKI